MDLNATAGCFQLSFELLTFDLKFRIMKHFTMLIACCLLLGLSSFAQKKKKNETNQTMVTTAQVVEPVRFSELVYDFGKIPQGKPTTHTFVIENTGLDTLIVENVQTSCGCTTPEYSRAPVLKGQKTTLKVGYNAAAEGAFEKSVTVYYNNGQAKQIIIRGNVWKTPDQSVPGNASLNVFQ